MSSRRQILLARVNWYRHSSLKHITELITGDKSYYRSGRCRQVSLYLSMLVLKLTHVRKIWRLFERDLVQWWTSILLLNFWRSLGLRRSCLIKASLFENIDYQMNLKKTYMTFVIHTAPADGQDRHLVMMTSSNGNIFRVTGHLCGEFTGPVTRSFDVFLSVSE